MRKLLGIIPQQCYFFLLDVRVLGGVVVAVAQLQAKRPGDEIGSRSAEKGLLQKSWEEVNQVNTFKDTLGSRVLISRSSVRIACERSCIRL